MRRSLIGGLLWYGMALLMEHLHAGSWETLAALLLMFAYGINLVG